MILDITSTFVRDVFFYILTTSATYRFKRLAVSELCSISCYGYISTWPKSVKQKTKSEDKKENFENKTVSKAHQI